MQTDNRPVLSREFLDRIASRIEVGADSGLKPLRPTPNIITAGDLKDYVNLLDPLIQSLDDDVRSNVSGLPADDLVKLADGLDAKAKEYEAVGTSIGDFMAAKLRAEAAKTRKMVEAQKKLSADQLTARGNFRTEWDAFFARWTPIAEKYRNVTFFTSGGDWTTLQGYDLEYQSFHKKYGELGLKPTMGVPPSAPDTPTAKVGDALKTVATIAGIGLVAYIGFQIFRK